MKHLDITGQTYGRLTALVRLEGRPTRWQFSCSCGRQKTLRMSTVRSGAVKSCGCLHLERCKTGLNRRKHGQARVGQVTRLHSIWRGMLKRCSPNGNHLCREHYGARGIAVCAEWRSFEAFMLWSSANGYRDDLTIDRVDVNGGYTPENCRWASVKEQCRNRTTTRWVTIDGVTKSLAEWREDAGISGPAFYARVKRGWSVEKALGKDRMNRITQ